MKINEKLLNFIDIINDLDDISKKLYLESPDAWIDFSGKIGDKHLDEMVLFYAAKFNYVSILKYVLDNNVIDLDTPSKNTTYSSIREHLLAVSKAYDSNNFHDFLVSGTISETKDSSEKEENLQTNDYSPVFICPHCSSNIFNSGYKIYEEVDFAFASLQNKIVELNRISDNRVFCSSCNNVINDITTTLLQDICCVHNCKKCGKDLTQVGISEKMSMNFDNKTSKFIANQKTYNCSSCSNELNESQIKYFNLK